MSPFRYGKTRHLRTQTPGSLSPYQKYKPYLRVEFEKKCVYCRMPDTMKDLESYGVDHYKPKRRFASLKNTYSNLFYCCNPCNRRKDEFWISSTQPTRFIPNPCDHVMYDHLRFKKASVVAVSDAGQCAKDLLDLDDPEAVAYRQFIETTISMYSNQLIEHSGVIKKLRKIPGAEADVANLTSACADIERSLARLRGS